MNSPKKLFLALLIISFLFRLFYLHQPPTYIFDEVYHVPTIRAYSQNNPAGYEWWQKAPEPNTAYDWLHPPLAKLIQAASVKLLGDHSLAWRLPSALFGTLSIAALYLFTLTIFKNHQLALIAAAIFSLDGLQLTMSRITMNDIFLVTWLLLTLKFFYQYFTAKTSKKSNQYLCLTAIFTGLSLATKHSAFLLYPIFILFLLPKIKHFFKHPKQLLLTAYSLLLIPTFIYFLSYTQFFLQGHTLKQFYQLHQQIYWYQANLTATHAYQSAAWQWPLLIRPVWFHVDYFKTTIANIYNLGNPAIFWVGLIALIYTLTQKLTQKTRYLLACYFILFLPWIFSPRILFLHHYLPALPFLCLIIAQVIHPRKSLTLFYLTLITITFLFFYPLNTAIPLPQNFLKYWFWLPTWR